MSVTNDNLLHPPTRSLNADHVVPLSPPVRPPFSHYHSMSTLPATPNAPYPNRTPAQDPVPMQSAPLRPYLTLSPRILLTFFSPPLLPIILTIAHSIQNRSSTASLASSLRSSFLSACSGIAKNAASIQAFPRCLAMQTNDEAVRATQESILAVGTMLMDAVTIIETVVNFIVDTYRSMLLCTIELAIRGTLDILIDAVQTISDNITSTLNSVRTDIQDDISSANNVIQSAVSAINSVTSIVDVNLSVPNFTIPSLSFLENVTAPTSFESTLLTLNSSIPDLSELKEKMNEIIDTPFELLIQQINSTRLEMAASFNSSLLPVPSLSSLAAQGSNDLHDRLCSDLDTSLIDDIAKSLHKLSTVAIGLMFLLLFLVWAALAIWEWRKWRALSGTVEVVEEEWRREGKSDAWRMITIVENPIMEKYGGPVLRRVAPAQRTRQNFRWFLSYLAHPTCLALLFVALLGFLSIQFQLVALNAIKEHARENANATVTASTDSLMTKLNAAASNTSQSYADEYNSVIAAYQNRIDNELFGPWLNTTAVTLNSSLVTFYDEIGSLLNATFGGTILYNPINTFICCILGSKITNLEEGLTWISNHAKITLPTVPADVLVLSNSSMNEMATPIASAAAGSSTNSSDDGLVGTLIDHFESALVVERNFYAIMLGVWLGLFLIGLIVVIWNSGGKDRYEAWRGINPDSPNTPKGEEGIITRAARWIPWFKDTHPIYDTYAEKEFRGNPDPIPIPRIVEPEKSSFFDYQPSTDTKAGEERPKVGRSGTFGNGNGNTMSFASLAAPGQAFLKIVGRKISGVSNSDRKEAEPRELVQGGMTSEKYTHDQKSDSRSGAETPPPFWVDKFYGALDGVKSIFPIRGQKHGAALGLGRSSSQRTEKSFGASRVPTAMTPGKDWQGARESIISSRHEGEGEGEGDEGMWTMIGPQFGRALDDDNGRYPSMPARQEMYPRPMSRAPTLMEGSTIPHRNPNANPFDDGNPFDLPPPTIPSKETYYESQQGQEGRQTYFQRPWETQYTTNTTNTEGERERGIMSPGSESKMSFVSDTPALALVTNASLGRQATATPITPQHHFSTTPTSSTQNPRGQVDGRGKGTKALTDILSEIKERQNQTQKQRDSFRG